MFCNNLLRACQELSWNSDIKVERMSHLEPRDLERQLIQNGEPDAWDEHSMGPQGPWQYIINAIKCGMDFRV